MTLEEKCRELRKHIAEQVVEWKRRRLSAMSGDDGIEYVDCCARTIAFQEIELMMLELSIPE